MADEASEPELRKTLHIIQSMIDVSSERLEGLRTKCSTTAELTQQEIRTLEGKLIKMFSEQIVIKSKMKNGCDQQLPSLTQWLEVVGLDKKSISCLCQKISSVEELQEKSEHELKSIVSEKGASPDDLNKLFRALHNLKRYTDVLRRGEKANADMHLYWDSWDHHHNNHFKTTGLSPRPRRSRAARASVPSEESLTLNNNGNREGAHIPPSASVSSIESLNASVSQSGVMLGPVPPLTPPPPLTGQGRGKGMKFPTTPPARRKHTIGNTPTLILDSYPLTKSKSHESQLAASKSEKDMSPSNGTVGRRARLPTEPGPETAGLTSPGLTSPVKSPPHSNTTADSDDSSCKSLSLQVPKSPRSIPVVGRKMTHQISHRFTKKFKMMSSCGYCQKPIFLAGLKCKDCKYTCHKECEDKVAPSCGLPQEFLDEFKKKLSLEGAQVFASPTSVRASNTKNFVNSLTRNRNRKSSHPQPLTNTPFPPPDSSSNTSSCNSSTPSSPAVQILTTPHSSHKPMFHFPDVPHNEAKDVILETHPLTPPMTTLTQMPTLAPMTTLTQLTTLTPLSTLNPATTLTPLSSLASLSTVQNLPHNDLTDTQQSQDSDRTASQTSGSTSTDSDRTPVRVDSQDSQVSDTETITDGHRWPRQNSLSLREWDIPYDELKMHEVIGTGRFGTVYRGQWHGDVAVKVLNMNYLQDEKTLQQFKNEVSIFRKTRHENLILFMGACMKPPHLAIVTSFSKGLTLYTHIHLRKDKFSMNKTSTIAQQLCQGMGYLHARGIVHKDLKTKNIFMDNANKVVITDFGLFSIAKLCFGKRNCNSLSIPPGWLCYLAPEIMRSLSAHQPHDDELPFSTATDIYAFGTVWYELLCGDWPFEGQSPEAIIWQVGKGIKQPLANLQASRDVKDILMLCWSFQPYERPDFIRLGTYFDKLPKKRLARSPSHPIHLSRSAESVF